MHTMTEYFTFDFNNIMLESIYAPLVVYGIFLLDVFMLSFFIGYVWYTTSNDLKELNELQSENNTSISDYLDDEYVVTIIRGVPGSGKNKLVEWYESGLDQNYAIVDWSDFFLNEDIYNFKSQDLPRAEIWAYNQYIDYLTNRVKRIYVVGYFPEVYSYEHYTYLAEKLGYSYEIVELYCPDTECLQYFNKRSIHNVPYQKSLKIYNSWETDSRSYIQYPYINGIEGYDVPKYDKATENINPCNMSICGVPYI